jgi:chloride channel protein, CIC family
VFRLSVIYLLKWICFAVSASTFGIGIIYSFRYVLIKTLALIHYSGIPFYCYPVFGALVCGLVIYRISPDSAGEGMPAYLHAVNKENGNLSLKATICKFFATLFTLGFGGSGGIVGPMVRVNSGIMSSLGNLYMKIGFTETDRRTIAICGASAVCSAAFQSPIGAGFLAVEILKRANMRYLDLFPSIITSCLCVTLIQFLNLPAIFPFHISIVNDNYLVAKNMLWIIALGSIAGGFSIIYVQFYGLIRKFMVRNYLSLINMLIGSIIVSCIAFLVHQDLLSVSFSYIENLTMGKGVWPFAEIFEGRTFFIVFLLLAVLKGLTNSITVGSGLSGGFIGPSVVIGLFLGAAMAQFLGIQANSGVFYAFLVAGMSGVLSGSLNAPIAAAIMGTEIFGSDYAASATISSIVSFQIARSSYLYDFPYENLLKEQIVGRGHT